MICFEDFKSVYLIREWKTSNSVFTSLVIYQILIHKKKISKNPKKSEKIWKNLKKNLKNPKKSKKSKDLFEDLKSVFGSEQPLEFCNYFICGFSCQVDAELR